MDTGEIPTRVGEFGAWCRCRIFGRSAHMCNAKQFGCAWFCLAHRRIPENGSWDSRRDSLQATAVVRYGGYAAALSLAALAQPNAKHLLSLLSEIWTTGSLMPTLLCRYYRPFLKRY